MTVRSAARLCGLAPLAGTEPTPGERIENMQLQIGKWYVDGTGAPVHITGPGTNPDHPFRGTRGGESLSYTEDGRFSLMRGLEPLALVAETEPPAPVSRSLRDCQPGDRLVWLADGTPVRFIAYVPECSFPVIVLVEGDRHTTHLDEDGSFRCHLEHPGTRIGRPEVGFPEEGGAK